MDMRRKSQCYWEEWRPDEEARSIHDDHPEDYIIIDDTDSDPDSSDDDYEDEAGADIMESSTNQNF